MLIFHFSSGGAQAQSSWGVLLVPLVFSLLTGDVLPALFALVRVAFEWFFGISLGSSSSSSTPQQQQQQRRPAPPQSRAGHGQPAASRTAQSSNAEQVLSEDELAWAMFAEFVRWLVFTFSAIAFFRFSVFVRQRGGWPALRQFLTTGRFPPPRPNAHGRGGAFARRTPPPPRVTVEAVAEALQKVPTELHVPKEQLQCMGVHDLKARLGARGVDCSRFLEKHELLHELHDSHGSSATSCSICYDDYAAGDPVRILPCGHKYHLECVDKWFLTATDFSRPPACPMCNAPLVKPAATASAAAAGTSAQAHQQHAHHQRGAAAAVAR